MKESWRKSVTKLKPYIPGKAIEEVKRELGLDEIIRLASNENPFGPSPKAVEAMQIAVKDSQLYPESTCRELREKLGNFYKIDPDQFLIANGADNIISLIGNAYINPGDEIIYCTPTFPAYRTITLLMEGTPVEVPLLAETGDLGVKLRTQRLRSLRTLVLRHQVPLVERDRLVLRETPDLAGLK